MATTALIDIYTHDYYYPYRYTCTHDYYYFYRYTTTALIDIQLLPL